jgi:hypothetical protein
MLLGPLLVDPAAFFVVGILNIFPDHALLKIIGVEIFFGYN